MKSQVLLGALAVATIFAGRAARADDRPQAERPPGVRFALKGPVGDALRDVTANWLMEAPAANPAMLGMFRDRDRMPLRDLLPWSGEFAGKYLAGATQVLLVRDDPGLERLLTRFVAELIALQDDDGYLGPFPKANRLTGTAPNIDGKDGSSWDAWGHYHIMLGLLLWEERTGDPPALAAAARIGDLLCDRFLGEGRPRLVDTGSTEMNLAPAHGLLLLHRRTGTGRHRELAEQIIGEFAAADEKGAPLAGDYLRRGLANEPFFRTPKPRWESLHPIMALAERARLGEDAKARTAFENLWWSIVELDRHNNGGFSSGEQAQGNPYHPGAIETCCTIAWMAMSVEMLKLTGNPIVADELELSTLNSALGLFAPSGRWSTYNTPMDGVRKANFHEIGFQCRPGSPELNCCSVNAARGLGLLGEWAVLRDESGLLLNWYGPGTISAPLNSGNVVTIAQETAYPAGGKVLLRVSPEHPEKFALRLRVPHWSSRTTVSVNGVPVPEVAPGRYLSLSRAWEAGDRVELNLDLSPRFWAGERECEGLTSIYRGPLLLAYDRRFNAIDPHDLPALDARGLDFTPVEPAERPAPMVLLEVAAKDGRRLRLRDFAGAGADGSPYHSWLKVDQVAPAPFRRDSPRRSGPATPEGE